MVDLDLTDDEVLALHELLVYGHSVRETVDAADRAVAKVRAVAKKIVSERRADERSRV